MYEGLTTSERIAAKRIAKENAFKIAVYDGAVIIAKTAIITAMLLFLCGFGERA